MTSMGVDIGNILSKAVILHNEEILASGIVETTGNIVDEIEDFMDSVAGRAGIERGSLDIIAATGSGADLVKGADLVEDEVTCAGASAGYLIQEIDLVVDIGGQSITTIFLDDYGEIVNFMRNDKCASGSGRFLEVMSGALGVEIAAIDDAVARAGKPVLMTSQCGVFGESEVITHVNDGKNPDDIVAGICESVGKIVVAQVRRFGMGHQYTLTGGVSRVESVVRLIEEKLVGTHHKFPYDPVLAAAIGAAMFGEMERDGTWGE